MRLNRKWLYLGGLVTILTLLLTLTLVLPAGAVGQLDDGSVSTDVDYVSPDTEKLLDPDDRTVTATLVNGDLDGTDTVEKDGDFEAVELQVDLSGTGFDSIDPVMHSTVLVNIRSGTSTDDVLAVMVPDAVNRGMIDKTAATYSRDVINVLPITGSLSVDFDATGSVSRSSIGTPRIVNPVIGLIEIPVRTNLSSGKIVLNYTTSPQETALLNVEGDHDDFDVVAVEGAAGPYGEYSGSFIVAESTNIKLDGRRDEGGIHDEQHEVPTGLRSNVQIDDEEIIARYRLLLNSAEQAIPSQRLTCVVRDEEPYARTVTPRCDAADQDTGETGVQEFVSEAGVDEGKIPGITTDTTVDSPNADTIASAEVVDSTDRTGRAGSDEERTFYIQVANPPILIGTGTNEGMGIATSTETDAIILEEPELFEFVDDTNQAGNGLVDAVRGILRVKYTGVEPLSVDEPVTVSYRSSDSFYVTVDRGPIQDIPFLEDSPLLDGTNGDTTNTDMNLVVPSPNNILVKASSHLRIISVDDGDTCQSCRVRIGVVTKIRGNQDEDDPTSLSGRITVLGITYQGSQRIPIKKGLDASSTATVVNTDDNTTTSTADLTTFTATLNLTPVDANGDDLFDEDDITIVRIGGNLTPCVANVCESVLVETVTQDENNKGEGERLVTFRLAGLSDGANSADNVDNIEADDLIDGSVFTDDSGETNAQAFIDVVYTGKVGANPRNALLSDLDDPVSTSPADKLPLPIIVVSDGGRVSVTSSNDEATVDVEKSAPKFANPSPGVGDATGNEDQVISVDITDDDLAGVNTKTVAFHVRVGTATTRTTLRTVDQANYKTASGNVITFDDIDGGVRASVALDDVDDGGRLRIDADRTPTILWFVTASDTAKNAGRSDNVANDPDKTATLGTQVYRFTVDGQATEIDRVYTGDWFDTVEERVEGDRRLGTGEYLPGSSDNTSVRVVFKDTIDGGSVDAADFTVDGTAPTAANWYAEGDTNPFEDPDSSSITASVFLTVSAMPADASPVVAIVGSISDKAGNSTSSGSKTATDGIAPTLVLSVDKALSQETVTVTVGSDERIRTLTPDLSLYVSNALDSGNDSTLDERDSFRVTCEKASEDTEEDNGTCDLALRHYADGVDPDAEGAVGEIIASGDDLDDGERIGIILSKNPILDADGDGEVGTSDLTVDGERNVPFSGSNSSPDVVSDAVKPAGTDAEKARIFNAEVGRITVETARNLKWGDRFIVSYRGVDPDLANALVSIPSGRQISATSWTFEVEIERADRYSATAAAEDNAFNRGRGGIGDPNNDDATVFEIDNQLAGGAAARTIPLPDVAGAVSITEPFFIELYWDGSKSKDEAFVAGNEGKEYPGDSSKTVTLTKAELDGDDVLSMAIRQTAGSWRLGISDIALGQHTFRYNAEDALGNTYDTDRTLGFTVQPVPSWDLGLTAGMNLISLPSDPANGNVNEIFGDVEQVELIFTFEGSQSKVAIRNQDTGEFVGTLDTIDAQHAYWISADNAATVEVSIPPTSQLAPPPYLNVKGGQWNLVPVMSLGAVDDDTKGEGAAPGTKTDADSYLGEFRTAFGWTGRSWNKIDPDGPTTDDFDRLVEGPEMSVGMGYWVLYEEDSIITP